MAIIVLLFVVYVLLTLAAVASAWEHRAVHLSFATLGALSMVHLLVFTSGPEALGYGRVPAEKETYTKRLSSEKIYRLLRSVETNKPDELMLVVRDESDPVSVFAIRVVKDRVPQEGHCFTLIDGVPAEIACRQL